MMSKAKFRFITLISLVALFALLFGFALSTLSVRRASAITYATTSIFSEGANTDVGASTAAEGGDSYLQFTFETDGSKIYYRRDLALKWYEAAEEGTTSDLARPGAAKYFSMTFAFGDIVYSRYTITFESGEENISKDGKATNALIFKVEEEMLKVAVKNAHQADAEDDDLYFADLTTLANAKKDIEITFSEPDASEGAVGEFVVNLKYDGTAVSLNDPASEDNTDRFTNIGGNYMEYRSSSSSTPNTPMTFSAEEAPEATGTENAPKQTVLMKSLNGQSFLLKDGQVEDNAKPVLVLDEEVYAYRLGQRFSLTYEAIDVCDDSVSVSRSYYMAKFSTEEGKEDLYVKPNETNDDHYKTLTTSTYFMPINDDGELGDQYVSIRFRLDDGSGGDKYYVYLSWYAAEGSLTTLNAGTDDAFDCILVTRDQSGPSYRGIDATSEAAMSAKDNIVDRDELNKAIENYKEEIKAATENLSAGDGAYFYLPSLRGLIGSSDADYRNLRFNIYYYNSDQTAGSSAKSATSLRYNALRFEVPTDGEYKFRVLATDAANNAMKMWLEGKLVDVSGSNIWEFDDIPEFTIEVDYTGATIEDAGEKTLGYRESVYSLEDFEIVAMSGYKKEYTLYRFDAAKLDGMSIPSYSDFVSDVEKYVEQFTAKEALIEVSEYNNNLDEDEGDNPYAWTPDSNLSFCPQESTFYVVRVIVTDPNRGNEKTTAYMVIDVQNPIDTVTARTNWFANNVTSVVLFSISGVLAIIIVILFVVKPSEKTVEEVDLAELKGGKKNSKK